MVELKISLETIEKVYSFVATVTKYEYDADVICGRYVVNAKSIMRLFSLDLLSPLTLNIHAENADELVAELAPYLA